MASYVDRLWDDEALSWRIVRVGLTPLAWAFGTAVAARAALYDAGVLRTTRTRIPVVSVGNLRVGGTGKTPLVIWMVEQLRARGVRTAVVARGYGGAGGATMISPAAAEPPAVADGEEIRKVRTQPHGEVEGRSDAIADEALLVALRTGAPVVTARDRVAACRLAEQAFLPQVIVLDDGFQHRRLARDLDIVIVGEGDVDARLLPAGPLREPLHALRRADVVVREGPATGAPRIRRSAAGLVRFVGADAELAPIATLSGRRVAAVAGIARPEGFLAMLRDAGAEIVASMVYADHHRYGADDWQTIERDAAGAELIVTTEKDLVKLAPLAHGEPRLIALRLAIEVEGGDALMDLICARSRLDAKQRRQHDRDPHERRRDA